MGIFSGQVTVDKVMATFTKTIADLTTVEENNVQIEKNLQVEQERIAEDMKAARTEADRAKSIRTKLEGLIA